MRCCPVERARSPNRSTSYELPNTCTASLTEDVPGPAAFAEYIRGFRYLTYFAMTCIAENTHPTLTRCWRDLERRFMRDPAFDDGVFVQSWVLFDFPFGSAGATALDHFDAFLEGKEARPRFQPFIEAARSSRLGLHQDVKMKLAGPY